MLSGRTGCAESSPTFAPKRAGLNAGLVRPTPPGRVILLNGPVPSPGKRYCSIRFSNAWNVRTVALSAAVLGAYSLVIGVLCLMRFRQVNACFAEDLPDLKPKRQRGA